MAQADNSCDQRCSSNNGIVIGTVGGIRGQPIDRKPLLPRVMFRQRIAY